MTGSYKHPAPLLPGDNARMDGYVRIINDYLAHVYASGGYMAPELVRISPTIARQCKNHLRYTLTGIWDGEKLLAEQAYPAQAQVEPLAPPFDPRALKTYAELTKPEDKSSAKTLPEADYSDVFISALGMVLQTPEKTGHYKITHIHHWTPAAIRAYETDQRRSNPAVWNIVVGHDDDVFPETFWYLKQQIDNHPYNSSIEHTNLHLDSSPKFLESAPNYSPTALEKGDSVQAIGATVKISDNKMQGQISLSEDARFYIDSKKITDYSDKGGSALITGTWDGQKIIAETIQSLPPSNANRFPPLTSNAICQGDRLVSLIKELATQNQTHSTLTAGTANLPEAQIEALTDDQLLTLPEVLAADTVYFMLDNTYTAMRWVLIHHWTEELTEVYRRDQRSEYPHSWAVLIGKPGDPLMDNPLTWQPVTST